DFLFILVVFQFSWWLKFKSGLMEYVFYLKYVDYLGWSIVYGIISILFGLSLQYYQPKRKKSFAFEALKIIQVHILSFLFLLSVLYISRTVDISREFLAIFLISNLLFSGVYRYFVKKTLHYFREKGYNKQFILILGAGSLGRRFYKSVQSRPELGFEVVGFLDDNILQHEQKYSGIKP